MKDEISNVLLKIWIETKTITKFKFKWTKPILGFTVFGLVENPKKKNWTILNMLWAYPYWIIVYLYKKSWYNLFAEKCNKHTMWLREFHIRFLISDLKQKGDDK